MTTEACADRPPLRHDMGVLEAMGNIIAMFMSEAGSGLGVELGR